MKTKYPNNRWDRELVIISLILVLFPLVFIGGCIYLLKPHNRVKKVENTPRVENIPHVELKDMIKTAPFPQTDKEFLGVEPNSEVFPNIIENLDTVVISGTIEDFIAAAEPTMPKE